MDINQILNEFKDCVCGVEHTVGIKDVVIGSGIVSDTGKILKRNGFKPSLLLVADKNTLRVSAGIKESLVESGFILTEYIYDDLRIADMANVNKIESLLMHTDGVIAVGTGSVHDTCRLAAARQDKMLCLFATAASMDGFASYSAPITDGCFKITYSAKTPEVIIADTKILAAAPNELKSAGFGDMVGKYVGLIDWQVSALLTGEYYCEKVANLTRTATDRIMALADDICVCSEDASAAVFEALLLTGIGMAFTKTSRPASGTEHILSHFWECIKLTKGELSDFHGKKVGVATLLIMKEYENLIKKPFVKAKKEEPDWDDIYSVYGILANEVRTLNTPDTITDSIDPQLIEKNWGRICDIVKGVPSYDQIFTAMKKAGAVTYTDEIGVSDELRETGLKYHPYMRRRLSLYRLKNMIE